MTLPANIRVNVRVPFPALVQGAAFITVAKANGIWTIKPNYQLLAAAPSITATQLVAVYDSASGVWNTVTPAQLGSGGGGGGDLLAANNLSDVVSKTTSFNNISPMTTPGDMIYGGASGAATRLPAGTSSQVLFGGTIPSWGSVPSGIPVAVGIGALQAMTLTSAALVYLSAGGRSGYFVGSTVNLANPVTYDPGQGIWIAPASDTTGASGAWVRQYTGPASIGWWGAVGDAVITFPVYFSFPTIVSGTDNSQALANWGTWARFQSSLGIPVIMMTPTPTGNGYLFNSINAGAFAAGIKKLVWYNNKALWQNTSSSTSNPWSGFSNPMIRTVSPFIAYKWLINQTTPGAYGFSMINAADVFVPAGSFVAGSNPQPYTIQSPGNTNWVAIGAANNNAGTTFIATGVGSGTGVAYNAGFQPGSWVMLGSIDVEYFGEPPNLQQFEYVKIDGITTYPAAAVSSASYNSGTGALALTFASAPYATAPVGGSNSYQYFTGIMVLVSGLTGSGVSSLNAQWPVLSVSSNGLTVTLQTVKGLGVLTIGGGTLGPNTIVQTQQNLRYEHRTDFPDEVVQVPFYTCGAARVWACDTGPFTYNGVTYPIITWDVDVEFYDLNLSFSQVYQYWSFAGRRIRTYNYEGPGFSETLCGHVSHSKPTLLFPGEPDKNIGSMEYDGLEFYNSGASPFSPGGPFGFQSPNDRLTIRNSKISNQLTTANTKSVYVENSDIGLLSIGGQIGFSSSQIFSGCRIFNTTGAFSLLDGSQTETIDGTNVAFGTAGGGAGSLAGVLTILKSAFPSGTGLWNAVPGMTVNLTAAGNGGTVLFTGATSNAINGNGVVLRIYEDATYYYIVTSLPFTTLPAWSNNKIILFRLAQAKFIRCTGSDTIRQASAANDNNLNYWEYLQISLGGSYQTEAFNYQSQFYGALTKLIVTPLQVGSAAGAFITITINTYDSTASFAEDTSNGLVVKIVVGLPGQRVITIGAFANAQTGDTVTVAGSVVTSSGLPTHKVLGGIPQIASSSVTYGATTSPMVLIEFFFDCGLVRKLIPTNFDSSGTNALSFATTGLLP